MPCKMALGGLVVLLLTGGSLLPFGAALGAPPESPAPLPLPVLPTQPTPGGTRPEPQGLVELLYQTQQEYRAESELLTLLHARPDSLQAPRLELARAKLYYRQGRHDAASLMLYSLLDRYPRGDTTVPATQLLVLSLLRQERIPAAAQGLWAFRSPSAPAPSLAAFSAPAPGTVDPGRLVAWSTAIPGAGFLALNRPDKAAAALGLNLFFLGATVAAARNHLPGPALLLGLVELTLYQGQRNATREEALRFNQRLRGRQVEQWALEQGEKSLLAFAFQTGF
ncbi:MAG: hypothetical protein OEW39_12145 [Deltaproteobacteria bacterium]|nr:hypothetical protein [Deltaproteobacteria bacterium]